MAITPALWIMLPAVVFAVLAAVLVREPPRWLVRVSGAATRRVPRRWRRALARLTARREASHGRPTFDPFDVLDVQMRLGMVAGHVRALEENPRVWARGRRMQATQSAYDALLAEACVLAGVEVLELDRVTTRSLEDPERLREELELASRGWSW